MPVAGRNVAGTWDVHVFDEASQVIATVFEGVEFLDVTSVGYPVRDELRSDVPHARGQATDVPHVLIPGGGSLYRVRTAETTGLMHVLPDGTPSMPLSVPSIEDGGLRAELHVGPDSATALVSTSPEAGGDVYVVGLTGGGTTRCLTSALPPLDVDRSSLRTSAAGSWFVAGGQLFAAPAGADAQAVSLPVEGEVLPEPALCAQGHRVAVVVRWLPDLRHIVVVDADGSATLVSDQPGSYDAPNLDHPLGPWLAIDPTGSRVAYRRTDVSHAWPAGSQEVLVSSVDAAGPVVHLTSNPEFPDYIDNAGILGFTAQGLLLFFAGDRTVSGVTSPLAIGAADLFAADVGVTGEVVVWNVSLTSGQLDPPFDVSGSLELTSAQLTPDGQTFLVQSGGEEGSHRLSAAPLPDSGAEPGVSLLLDQLDEAPDLDLLGDRVLVSSEWDEDEQEGAADGGTQTYMLDTQGLAPALESFLALPEEVEIDRFTRDPSGAAAAFVAVLDDGQELAIHVDLATQSIGAYWLDPLQISQVMAFSSSGSLYLGMGPANGGPATMVVFFEQGLPTALPLPPGEVLPLPH